MAASRRNEILLAGAGLMVLAPKLIRSRVPCALAAGFALLDLYGMIFVALPYYTGLIVHKSNGFLAAFDPARLGLSELLNF